MSGTAVLEPEVREADADGVVDDIVHCSCAFCNQTWPEERVALCGADLMGATQVESDEDCVVCVDLLESTGKCRRGHYLMY